MIIIILGMHRSGTSALAGLLHHNGVMMGKEDEFYPKPMKENPKGFYENVRFRRINDRILRRYDYRVKSFSPSVPTIYPVSDGNLLTLMKKLILEYNGEYDFWGWKDPRTCLTLYSWLRVIEDLGLFHEVRIIQMKRNVENIADSMRRRGNKEKYEGQFIHLALKYYNKCHFYTDFVYCRKAKMMTLFFEDELLENTEDVCKRLSSFLKLEINDYSFIDPSISRQTRN